MTSVAVDLATYLKGLFPGINFYDPTTLNKATEGVLIEQNPNPVSDVFLNYETTTVTISVRETGRGVRGTSKAYDDAVKIYNALRIIQDITINGTQYDIISAEGTPYELYGGADFSIWKFTVSIERATEDIAWQ